MKCPIALASFLWRATIILNFIPMVSGCTLPIVVVLGLLPKCTNITYSFDNSEGQRGRLRKKKNGAHEGKVFMLDTSKEINAAFPMGRCNSSNRMSSISLTAIALLEDENGLLTYYTARVNSSVQPSLDYMFEFGTRHDDIANFSKIISDQLLVLDDLVEPQIKSSKLRKLVKKWGALCGSKGNCYRYAANDPSKCPYRDYFFDKKGFTRWFCEVHEMPGDNRNISSGATACRQLVEGSIKDGMYEKPPAGCSNGDTEVAIVAATKKRRFVDMHLYRKMDDDTWTHKPGDWVVLDTDASFKKINKQNLPEDCDRDYSKNPLIGANYERFCGYLCVPNGSIDVDKGDHPSPCL